MTALSSCATAKTIDWRGRIQLTITTSVLKHCGVDFFSVASQCWNRLSWHQARYIGIPSRTRQMAIWSPLQNSLGSRVNLCNLLFRNLMYRSTPKSSPRRKGKYLSILRIPNIRPNAKPGPRQKNSLEIILQARLVNITPIQLYLSTAVNITSMRKAEKHIRGSYLEALTWCRIRPSRCRLLRSQSAC